MARIEAKACLLIILLTISRTESLDLCDTRAVDIDNYTISTTELCGCDKKPPCVRKCCRDGFYHYHDEDLESSLYVSVCLKNDFSSNFSVPIYDDLTKRYEKKDSFMVGMLHCNNKDWYQYFKMNNDDPRQKFFVQEDGRLYYKHYEKFYDNNRYCLDELDGLTAYVCFTPPNPYLRTEKIIHISAKVIPLPFLLMTFIIYAILPESTIHNRALMCHVFALFFGYISLALNQYTIIEDHLTCLILGGVVIYSMFASFFWMNIMCIDIWYAFSGWRKFHGQSRTKKLFIACCVYGWGLPALIVLILFLFNTYGDRSTHYHPGIGRIICFLSGHLPTLLYYFVPVLILIIINTVLFILTAYNIHKMRKETAALEGSENRRHYSKDDEMKFKLYWKLLIAMGINPVINSHVIQTISWVGGWKLEEETARYLWFIKDFAHAMYGIVIFIIFVCNRKIWLLLKKRFHKIKGKITSPDTSRTVTSSDTSTKTENGFQLNELKNEANENAR